MATFKTWEKAASYYKICYVSGGIQICKPRAAQTPIHSPARKKQKFSTLGSPSLSSGQYSPLFFPNSPPSADHPMAQGTAGDSVEQLAKIINSHKYPHHRAQATAHLNLTPSPQIFPPWVIVVDSSDDSVIAATGATDSEEDNSLSYKNAVALPLPTSSLVVEFHSDLPVTLKANSSVIVIPDSDEEEFEFDPDTQCSLDYMLRGVEKPGPTPCSHRHF